MISCILCAKILNGERNHRERVTDERLRGNSTPAVSLSSATAVTAFGHRRLRTRRHQGGVSVRTVGDLSRAGSVVLRNIAENYRRITARRFAERAHEFRAERASMQQKARESGLLIHESSGGKGTVLDIQA